MHSNDQQVIHESKKFAVTNNTSLNNKMLLILSQTT